jgi:Mg2+ and Co2+ transporter CorA
VKNESKEMMMSQGQNEWLDPSSPEEAEVRFLAENTDLSPEQAKELVRKHGPDRAKLLEEAKTMKAES